MRNCQSSPVLTQVIRQFSIDELKKRVKIAQLPLNVRLIHVKVLLLRVTRVPIVRMRQTETHHARHESNEAPERIDFVLHDDQDGTEEIVHALHVTCRRTRTLKKESRADVSTNPDRN